MFSGSLHKLHTLSASVGARRGTSEKQKSDGRPCGGSAGTLRERASARRIAILRELRSSAPTADDARVLAALRLTHDPQLASDSGRAVVPEPQGVPPNSVPVHSGVDGATTVQPQFPDGGVSLEVMKAIARDERVTAESSTDFVCHTILKPATVPMGWAELIEPRVMPWGTMYVASYQQQGASDTQTGPPCGTMCLADKLRKMGHTGVGTANVFFSHAWKFKFVDVVSAMATFVERERSAGNDKAIFFWMDCVVVDEHASQSFPPKWWETAFAQAVASIGHTCLMMTPWDAPIVITRAWCLWEIYCTMEAERDGCRLTLALSPAEEDAFLAALVTDGVEAVLKPFAAIDCRLAEATNPDDLAKIQEAISSGPGHDRLNAGILKRLRQWVTEVVAARLDTFGSGQEQVPWNEAACQLALRFIQLLVQQGRKSEALILIMEMLHVAAGQECVMDEDGNPTCEFCPSHRPLGALTCHGTHLYGPEDKFVLDIKFRLPICATMDSKEKVALVKILVDSYTSVDGADAVSTLSAQTYRGFCLTSMEPQEALALFEELLPRMNRILGPLHRETLIAKINYGILLGSVLEDWKSAEPILKEAAAANVKALGKNHPDTLWVRGNLAQTLKKLGSFGAARLEYEAVVHGKIVQLGETHAETLTNMWNLALLLNKIGELQGAVKLLHDCATSALANLDMGSGHEATLRYTAMLRKVKDRLLGSDLGMFTLESPWVRYVDQGDIHEAQQVTISLRDPRAYFIRDGTGQRSLMTPAEGFNDQVEESAAEFEKEWSALVVAHFGLLYPSSRLEDLIGLLVTASNGRTGTVLEYCHQLIFTVSWAETEPERTSTELVDLSQPGYTIPRPDSLKPESPWTQYTNDTRGFFVHGTSGEQRLLEPNEGFQAAIEMDVDTFMSYYQPLRERQAKIDAGLLNPESPWVQCTSPITSDERSFYLRRGATGGRFTYCLVPPAVGVNDEEQLPSVEEFDSIYTLQLEKQAKTEAGLLNPESRWHKWECAGRVLFSQGPGLENKSLATPAEGVSDERYPPAEVFDELFAQLL